MTTATTSIYDYQQPSQPIANTNTPGSATQEKIKSISIKQLDRGYTVEVGCQIFAIESATELITYLSTYILKPSETEELYYQGKLFK
jgi:hypothetical protein